MGLSLKPEPFTRRRHCILPQNLSAVLELVLRAWPYEVLSQENAPPTGGLYFRQADKSGFILTAGNRQQTFWNVIVELESGIDQLQLTVYADRPGKEMQFNDLAVHAFMDLRRVLASAGGQFPDWDTTDVFAMIAIPSR